MIFISILILYIFILLNLIEKCLHSFKNAFLAFLKDLLFLASDLFADSEDTDFDVAAILEEFEQTQMQATTSGQVALQKTKKTKSVQNATGPDMSQWVFNGPVTMNINQK